jgi:hypothetical protein
MYKKAITVTEIKGRCIETIPSGTVFEVFVNMEKSLGYSSCRGLGITSIWNSEFELIENIEKEKKL